jgi:hypothetical protein
VGRAEEGRLIIGRKRGPDGRAGVREAIGFRPSSVEVAGDLHATSSHQALIDAFLWGKVAVWAWEATPDPQGGSAPGPMEFSRPFHSGGYALGCPLPF